ncbi:MAG TPA: hypothetical protein VHV10_02935, partial [Ktedonobacteraceae bacterium]|nr:hypothetical protein [Ktedonobacteraceae bacterium]
GLACYELKQLVIARRERRCRGLRRQPLQQGQQATLLQHFCPGERLTTVARVRSEDEMHMVKADINLYSTIIDFLSQLCQLCT